MRKLIPIVLALSFAAGCFAPDVPSHICTEKKPNCPDGQECNFNQERCVPKGSKLDAAGDAAKWVETAPDLKPDAPAREAQVPDQAVDKQTPSPDKQSDLQSSDGPLVVPKLVAWYRMEQDTSQVIDSSGFDNHGQIYGTVKRAYAGKLGNGFKFTAGGHIQVKKSKSLSLGAGNMAVMFWINITTKKAQDVMNNIEASSGKGFNIHFDGVNLNISFCTGPGVCDKIPIKPFPSGSWHHVAAIIDRTNMIAASYLDSAPKGTKVIPKSGSYLSGDPLKIGLKKTTSISFAGLLDEVKIFDEALTQSQLAKEKTASKCPHSTISVGTAANNVGSRMAEVISLSPSRFLVTWDSHLSSSASSGEVYGRIFSTCGVPLDNPMQLNTNSTNAQYWVRATRLNGGGFVAAWASYGADKSGWGVVGQLFDSKGTKSGSPFVINQATAGDQDMPTLASISSGGFLACYRGQDTDKGGIFCRPFSNTGTYLANEFPVNKVTNGEQTHPTAVRGDPSGMIFVLWQSDETGKGNNIYGRTMTAMGKSMGTVFLANAAKATATTSKQYPTATTLTTGFVAGWMSNNQDGSDWSTVGRIFDSTGKPGTEFVLNNLTPGAQQYPALAQLDKAGFMACWDGLPGASVYCRRFTNAGVAPAGQFKVPQSIIGGSHLYPSVTRLDDGHYVVSWLDQLIKGGPYQVRLRVLPY